MLKTNTMEPVERVHPTFPIDENIELHEKAWVIQRVGWAVLGVFVIMACLGLFGTGWLSHARLEEQGNVVQYERFGRLSTPFSMTLYAPADDEGIIRIRIPQDYFSRYELQTIVPKPSEQTVENGAYYFRYDHIDQANINAIRLYLLPKRMGSISQTIAVNDTPFTLTQFVYP